MPTKKTERIAKKSIDPAATAVIVAIITIIGTITVAVIGAPWFKDVIIPIPIPTLTVIPSVTSTITSTFTSPPPILNSTSMCNSNLAENLFNYALNENKKLSSGLGNEVGHLFCVPSSYQPFENGEMLWLSNDPNIYVLFSTHEWKAYKNNYRSGNPTPSCDTELLSKNQWQHQPELGFGKIWCDNPIVKEKLGYATIEESPNDRAIRTFENGWLILINYTVHAIFYEKEQWEIFDVFNSTQISLKLRSDLDTKRSNLGLEQKSPVLLPKEPLTILDPLSGKPLTVLFEVGPKVSTQCHDTSEHPNKIQITTNIPHPVRVYLLVQAGWGVKSYEYQIIGKVSLKFDIGESIETPLQLGLNIRDWADRSIAITTLTSRYTQTAWQGFDEVPGKIDVLILDIPEDYSSSILKEIQIEDNSMSMPVTKSMDPCIHLSAITVSYLP